jgi:hypothetical protein
MNMDRNASPQPNIQVQSTEINSYWSVIQRLPSLSGCLQPSNFRFPLSSPVKARIIQIGPESSTDILSLSMGQDKERARFKQTIALEYQAVQTRLSLFEDLCPVTVDLIGETFGYPDPELFAIHLNQSGTHSTSYSDPSPRGWTGSPFKHSHASIRWYRSGTMPASMLGLEEPGR